MIPAAPVRRIDISFLAPSGEFNPEPIRPGGFPYLFAAPPTRVFARQEHFIVAGRDAPGEKPDAAAERFATASARTALRGSPSTGCAPPSNRRRRPLTGRHAGSPRHE